MRRSQQRQDAARIGERRLGVRGCWPEGGAQIAPPLIWIRLGIVEQTAPNAVGVFVFAPVAACGIQRSVRVTAASAGAAGALAALEEEGLAEFHAVRAEKVRRLAECRGGRGISPKQHALSPGPHAVEQSVAAPLLIQIAVAIAKKAARAVRKAENGIDPVALARHFEFPDGRLVVTQPLMFRPIFRRNLDRHAGFHGDVDHLLIDALGVHVDLDRPARAADPLEQRPPEIVAAFGNAPLAVYPQSEAAYAGTGLQK